MLRATASFQRAPPVFPQPPGCWGISPAAANQQHTKRARGRPGTAALLLAGVKMLLQWAQAPPFGFKRDASMPGLSANAGRQQLSSCPCCLSTDRARAALREGDAEPREGKTVVLLLPLPCPASPVL